jgi:hypothetical protein
MFPELADWIASSLATTPIVIFSISTEGAEEEIGANVCVVRPDNFNQLRMLLMRVLYEGSSEQ